MGFFAKLFRTQQSARTESFEVLMQKYKQAHNQPLGYTGARHYTLTKTNRNPSKPRCLIPLPGLVLASTLALLLASCGPSQKQAPTFEWLQWYLTDTYATDLVDGGKTYSITGDGKASGVCYLVVECHLLPELTGKDYELTLEHFRLILADGSSADISHAISWKRVHPLRGSTEKVVALKGAFLFVVNEARARRGGLHFMFKQHNPVALDAKNHRDPKLNPEF